jgi:hypothetical protein
MINKNLEHILTEIKTTEEVKDITEEVKVEDKRKEQLLIFGYIEDEWSKLSREDRRKAIFKALL